MTMTMTTTTRRMLAALLAVGALSVTAPGVAHADVECHTIDATGAGTETGPGTTTATIRGGGLLTGRTDGVFPFAQETENGLLIAGTVTFTVNQATLTVPVEGTLSFPAPGRLEFDVISTPNGISGTGKLAGATGTLRLAGEGIPGGSFTETVTGEICVDLSPRS